MRALIAMLALLSGVPAAAGTLTLAPTPITEWKAVYGRVEARDTVSARARIGGIVADLAVSEGDSVTEGQHLATVRDDKIAFQIAALEAQMRALQSQLATAETELTRGEALVERGVATAQRLDQLRTTVDVTRNQLASSEAQREVVVQQQAEGAVVAPGDGRVLTVPVTRGAVVLAGEPIATIGGGGFFLRLAIPERHAATLQEGAPIRITANGAESAGRLVKIYPQIENGRVIADVSVDHLEIAFVDARVLVEVPVGTRDALMVPRAAVETRSGIDFVTLREGETDTARAVLLGEGGVDGDLVEVLTGLAPGDVVITP
jgi:RND family efflux transporter MFP subunit